MNPKMGERTQSDTDILARLDFLSEHSDRDLTTFELKQRLEVDSLDRAMGNLDTGAHNNWVRAASFLEGGHDQYVRYHFGDLEGNPHILGLVVFSNSLDNLVVDTFEKEGRVGSGIARLEEGAPKVREEWSRAKARMAQWVLKKMGDRYQPNTAMYRFVQQALPDSLLPAEERKIDTGGYKESIHYAKAVAERYLRLFGIGPLAERQGYWDRKAHGHKDRETSRNYTLPAIKKVLEENRVVGKGRLGRMHLLSLLYSPVFTTYGRTSWERVGTLVAPKTEQLSATSEPVYRLVTARRAR